MGLFSQNNSLTHLCMSGPKERIFSAIPQHPNSQHIQPPDCGSTGFINSFFRLTSPKDARDPRLQPEYSAEENYNHLNDPDIHNNIYRACWCVVPSRLAGASPEW